MRKVIFSPGAQQKLEILLDYLKKEFGETGKRQFITKLDKSLDRVKRFPESCPISSKKPGLYKCVITKRTTLYYRIRSSNLEVVSLFDSRENQSSKI